MIIKVSRDIDFAQQIGNDIYFDLVDHDKVRQFDIQKQTPFSAFKEEVAKEFGVPAQFQRFWFWAERPTRTYRPKRPLTPPEEAQSVGQLWGASNKTDDAELKLFLEVELGPDYLPVQPPEKTKDDLLLFFKFYDPEAGKLRYAGRLFLKSSGKPIEILEKLNQMAGFAPDEEIELYEEIKFEPSVMCKHLDKRTSFRQRQIGDGDIICFQKAPPPESEESCQYPDVPSFLEYVHNRQEGRKQIMDNKFTWKIVNFTKLKDKKHYSPVFTLGGYKWRILIFSNGNNVDHLSMYLDVPDSERLPSGWSRCADLITLSVMNQIDETRTIRKETKHLFRAFASDWGFTSFMPLSDLNDPTRGYLVNDTIIVEAQVVVRRPESVPSQVVVRSRPKRVVVRRPKRVHSQVVVRRPESVHSQGIELDMDVRIGDKETKDPVLEPKMTATCNEQDQEMAKTDSTDGLVPDSVLSQGESEKRARGTEICFDERATSLLEKLEDDKDPHFFRIADFKEIPSDNYVGVGIFMVPASLESYAKELLARHADIGTGNSPVPYVNEMVFVVLCAALKSMDTTRFSEMTESSILKWRDAIRGALQFDFKVEFLKDHLKSITEAYLGKSARNCDASQELQATDEKIRAIEKELDTLKAHRSEMYNKVYTELRRTCEATSAKFPGETYGSLFN